MFVAPTNGCRRSAIILSLKGVSLLGFFSILCNCLTRPEVTQPGFKPTTRHPYPRRSISCLQEYDVSLLALTFDLCSRWLQDIVDEAAATVQPLRARPVFTSDAAAAFNVFLIALHNDEKRRGLDQGRGPERSRTRTLLLLTESAAVRVWVL